MVKNPMKLPKAYATEVAKLQTDLTISVNPLGCSPCALEAVRTLSATDLSQYPDPEPLIAALYEKFALPKGSVIPGVGSEQLIKLISLTFLRPGDTAAVEAGSFFLFSKEPKIAGARVRFVPLTKAAQLRKKPKLLFLANPTTPAGTDRTNAELLRAIDRIQPEIAVIDEANGEFRNDSSVKEIRNRKNIIVLRTFSKTIGLAGLRIGFAAGPKRLISQLRQRQQPFPITTPALRAAQAALADTAFLENSIAFINRERNRIVRELNNRGIQTVPSVTNNLFVLRPDAGIMVRELATLGVGVIDGSFFPKNTTPGFRISLRDRKTNSAFLRAIDEILACRRSKKLLRSKEVV